MKKEICITMTCERARNLSIVKTLASSGHFPSRIAEKEAWFLSPLRSETQASFKVSLKLNRWYDFGIGTGGNGLDLIVAMNKCSVKQALEFLSNEQEFFSFHQQNLKRKTASNIVVFEVKPIQHPGLIQYLGIRRISISIAEHYCKEVWYRLNGKQYFALGLQTNKGGWELRNKYFKGSNSPKSYTYLKTNSDRLILLEGMFDLLSLAELFPKELEDSDIIVLNSLAFLQQITPHFKNYREVNLYLDNDQAGNKNKKLLFQNYKNTKDRSELFQEYKDLNEKLVSIRSTRKKIKK
ncbi:toprim domain-containing protein [Christiangramia sediminicola]|uniref:Toprim domain-containing protein n=1 Tax=Christiangramia sediminicola TaxID=3073267 RepID=A0ABU1ETL3_9FLAO|nr:toprim domain-containing protein [Christiangramia sp. SM2212]MDR5591332.1 toprim domain-containing protein [Christiangramia sp. SM2212]